MLKRFLPVCSRLCSIVLPTASLLLLALSAAQPVGAQVQPHVAIPLNHVNLLSLQCNADRAVLAGQTVTIQANGTSFQGLPLQYSFGASAGRLEQKGNSAFLHTNGLALQVVNVTCTVADTQGRKVSQNIAITITAALIGSGTTRLPTAAPTSTPPPPPPPPVATHPTVAAPPAETPSSEIKVKPPEKVESARPPTHPAPPAPSPTTSAPAPTQGQGSGHGTQSSPVQPAPVTGAKAPDEYQQSESVEQWVSHLRQGKIEYQVPTRMTMQVASTVTVVIHGYQDVGTTTLPSATGSGSLKQSEHMKVELLAPENPGAFTIAADGDTVRFVPINGTTTWMWTVTPNTAGNNLKLEVRASVIYPGTDDKTEQQVETYDATVAVAVQPFWSTAFDYIRDHPLQVLGYLIPGGAGFTFLAGLVVWWWKRRHKGEAADAATVPPSKPPQRKRRS